MTTRVKDLIAEANGLRPGVARMAVAEEAVRAADATNDIRLGYEARMAALESAVFGGFPAKALVAFSWLTATCDRDPENFPESRTMGGFLLLQVDLLWAYKWVVQHLPGFPEISRAKIEDTLAEMEHRYTRNGYSLRPVWMNRAWVAMELGDSTDAVADCFARWELAGRDAYADCEACEQNFRVEVNRYIGNWDREVSAAAPLLSGELACAEVPHLTISNLVMPMWLHGEPEQAARLHKRGYEMCRENRDFLAELAEHVDYRIVVGDVEGALEIAERHLHWVQQTRSARRKWRWASTLGELFATLATQRETIALQMPRELGPGGAGPYRVAELSDWFERQADEYAAAFDARNLNDSVTVRTQELRQRLRDAQLSM